MKTLKLIGWIAVGLGLAAALALVLGLAVMWLWNWLMPELFGLPTIDYWQSVGLLLLSHLLLRGPSFGHRRSRRETLCRDDRERGDFARRFQTKLRDARVETEDPRTLGDEPG